MAKTNWQDKTSVDEMLASHINGLQSSVGKMENILNMGTASVTDEQLALLADYNGVYRIAQATNKNWVSSPAPVIKKNGAVISTGFTIDYAGGAVIFPADQQGNTFTASFTYIAEKAYKFDEMGEARAAIVRDSIHSGLTQLSDIDFSVATANPNKIKLLKDSVAYVNGYKVTIPAGTFITLNAPPVSGKREDLVFLEAWFPQNDNTGNMGWRIRVVDGVDFSKYPDGLEFWNSSYASVTNDKVQAQGGNAAPLNYVGAWSNVNDAWKYSGFFEERYRTEYAMSGKGVALGDVGLFVAGDGSATAKSNLLTADGYVYAIPLFRIKRRNNAGYSASNPHGAREYLDLGTVTSEEAKTLFLNDIVLVKTSKTTTGLQVGDFVLDSNNAVFGQITEIVDTLKFRIKNLYWSGTTVSVGMTLSTNVKLKSDRPDSLYSNIIDTRDIIDLCHKVSLTGFNYQQLLEENFDKLLRGELTTKDTKQMQRTYFGIPKTPIDANTVFYASFDGTAVAEVGGSPTSTTGTPIKGYMPGVTGLSAIMYGISGNHVLTWNNLPVAGTVHTIDIWIDTNKMTFNGGFARICTFYNLDLIFNDQHQLLVGAWTERETVAKVSAGIHHIRVTYVNRLLKVYIDGTLITTKQKTFDNANATSLEIGGSDGSGRVGGISDLMISNIDRGSTFTTLPADFISGDAKIAPAFGQRRNYGDPVTAQTEVGIAKPNAGGASKGLTVTQAVQGNWANGDTIKVKGLGGEIISGVIDADTALARNVRTITSNTISGHQFEVDNASALAVNDVLIAVWSNGVVESGYPLTITAIDGNIITATTSPYTFNFTGISYFVERTTSTSSPLAKFMNGSTKTDVAGTWSNLGTNEVTFTLGTNASLTNQDIEISYSLNSPAGYGQIEVFTETLQGEVRGKKLVVGTVAIRDDFSGKVSGSTVENPHISKHNNLAGNTTLLSPSSFTAETGSYIKLSALDGDSLLINNTTNASISQTLFSFNLIRLIEDKYGTIPAIDKVQWLKNNIQIINFDWWGFASNPGIKKASLRTWKATTSSWTDNVYTGNDVVTKLSLSHSSGGTYATEEKITSDGFIHYLAFAEASDGVTSSTIYTDYANITVQLKSKTGYDTLVPENPRRDDGLAGILLVRKETKEVETMFPVTNADGITVWGNYVPYQGLTKQAGTVLATSDDLIISTTGTGASTATTNYKNVANKLPVYSKASSLVGDAVFSETSEPVATVKAISTKQVGKSTTDGTILIGRNLDKSLNKVVSGADLVNVNGEMFLKVRSKYGVDAAVTNNDTYTADYRLQGRPLVKN